MLYVIQLNQDAHDQTPQKIDRNRPPGKKQTFVQLLHLRTDDKPERCTNKST